MSGFLQSIGNLKPANLLLVQACIVILVPYLLWRTMQLSRWFPLGVVQIFTGMLLGPGIFGALYPEAFQALFAGTRTGGIAALATIAVCLFGFLAGADADKEQIIKSGRSIVAIGVPGMLVGWGVAMIGGLWIYYNVPEAHCTPIAPGTKVPCSSPNVFAFTIAYGLLIAVSALPILALILRELKITKNRLGAVSLASAGLADTMMWIGLAFVVALIGIGKKTIVEAVGVALLGGVLSIGFILYVAGPILNRLIKNEAPESAIMSLAALSIFVASAITSITELHPVLGAFVAGVFLPDKVREMAAHRLDQPTSLVLMPFFFLNTGLKTDFSLVDPNMWLLSGLSIFLCLFGKIIGHGVAAKMTGETTPFSLGVGLLLQTKGLMGLIVLVVFLEKQVVTPLMFSAAVVMCMVSTGLPVPIMRILMRVYGKSLLDGKMPIAPPVVEADPNAAAAVRARAAPSPGALASVDFDGPFGAYDIYLPRMVIGRHVDDNIRVNDVRVSRQHAVLQQTADGGFEIHNQTADRANANPIHVNGELKEHAKLKDGDKVSLGGVEFTFHLPKAA